MSRTRLITFTVRNTGAGAVNVQFGVDDERFSVPEQIELLQPGEQVQRSSTFTMPDNATAPSDFSCTLTSTATDLASFETVQDQTILTVNVRASTITVSNVSFGTKDVLVNTGTNTANVTFTNNTKFPTTISGVTRSSGSSLFTASASGVTIQPYSSATIPIVLTLETTTPIGSVSATFGFSFTRDGATKTSSFTASAVLVEDSAVVTASTPVSLGTADQNHTGDLTAGVTFTSTSKQRSVDILSVEYLSGTDIVTINDADFTLAAEASVQKTLTGKTGLTAGTKSGVYRYTYQFAGAAGTKTGTFTATMTVTQVYQISINPDHAGTVELPVANTAGYVDVVVTSTAGWAVSSTSGFLSFSKTSGANGDTVRISWTQNTGTARSGSATFTCGTATAEFTMEQAMVDTTFNIPNVPVSLPESGATTSATVQIALVTGVDIGQYDAATWSVASKPAWVTSASITGTGKSVTLTYTYTTNTSLTNTRTGTISVEAVGETTLTGSVNLTQAAAAPTLSLLYSGSPTSSWAPPAAASARTISIQSNTTWSCSSDAAWLLVSDSTGTGNASQGLTVLENTGVVRVGTVTVSTTTGSPQVVKTITVTQAAVADAINIVQTTVNLPDPSASQSGSLTIDSVAPDNASWTIERDANATWLTLGASGGVGNGSVGYTTGAENFTPNAKTATITATRGEATDTCSIVLPAPTLSVSGQPSSVSLNGETTGNISVTTNSSSWTVLLKDTNGNTITWLTLVPVSAVAFKLTAVANNTAASRTARVHVVVGDGSSGNKEVTFDVSQAVQNMTLTSEITAGADAGSTSALTLSCISYTFPWTATASTGIQIAKDTDPWGSTVSYSSSKTFTAKVLDANTTASIRTVGTIVAVADDNPNITQTCVVKQAACTASLSGTGTFAADGQQRAFNVDITGAPTWVAEIINDTYSAFTLSGVTTGTTDTTGGLIVTASANPEEVSRTATLRIKIGSTVVATLSLSQYALTVSPTSWQFAASSPANKSFVVTTDANTSYTADIQTNLTGNALSIVSGGTDAGGGGTIVVGCTTNTGVAKTGGVLRITYGGITKTVSITQAAAADDVTLSPATSSPTADAQDVSLTISNISPVSTTCTASSNQAWATPSKTSGITNETITVGLTANNTASTRTATITITRGTTSKTCVITQGAASATWGSSSLSFVAAGETKSDTLTIVGGISGTFSLVNASVFSITDSGGTNHDYGTVTDDTTVYVKAAANTEGSRTGTLRFTPAGGVGGNKDVSLTQAAGATVSVNPTSASFNPDGEDKSVAITANGAWTATLSGDAAYSIVGSATGTGNGSVTVRATLNASGSTRTGTLTVTRDGTGVTATTSLSQNAATLSVSPTSWSNIVAAGASKSDFVVTTNIVSNAKLEVKSKPAWISSASITTTAVSLTAAANTGDARSGTVVVGAVGTTALNVSISVAQLAASNASVLWDSNSSTTLSVGSGQLIPAGSISSTGLTGAWSLAVSDGTWMTPNMTSGTGNLVAIQINTEANTGAARPGTVTVTSGGVDYVLTLNQEAGSSPSVLWVPINWTVLDTPSTRSIPAGYISSTGLSGTWTLSVSDTWMTPTMDTGTGNLDEIQINTDENTGAYRPGTITVVSGGVNYYLILNQAAGPWPPTPWPPTVIPDDTEVSVPASITVDGKTATFGRIEVVEDTAKYRYRNVGESIFVYYADGTWYNADTNQPESRTIVGGTPSGLPWPMVICSSDYGTMRLTNYWPAEASYGPAYDFTSDVGSNTCTYDEYSTSWVQSPGTISEGQCPS